MDAVTTDTCFMMQKDDVNIPIYARECYDASRATKENEKKFCTFNSLNGQYGWVDEALHFMEKQRGAVGKDVEEDPAKQLS